MAEARKRTISAMIIQTNPEAFTKRLPVHTVIDIGRLSQEVTLSGSDGSSLKVSLKSWGRLEVGHPDIGSKVQLLPENS